MSRVLIALVIFLSAAHAYGHNKVVVVPLSGDDAPASMVYQIGDTGPAGGKVFYITHGGLHGLEVTPVDLDNSPWGCLGTPITSGSGADGTAIGTGVQNTAAILLDCNSTEVTAAKIVRAYSLNGFFDWYLPSIDELYELYLQRAAVGGTFPPSGYWSSSEFSTDQAWFLNFGGNGSGQLPLKSDKDIGTFEVRGIRAF